MKLFPAIDLRGGQVVRLTQGDYDRMTVYGADPAAQAAAFRHRYLAGILQWNTATLLVRYLLM